MTIAERPEAIVSRANISAISGGFADSPTNVLITTFNTSILPENATAFAHRFTKSQLSPVNDDVLVVSSLNRDNVFISPEQIASKNSPSFRIHSGLAGTA